MTPSRRPDTTPIELRCTVVDARTGRRYDVEVAAPTGATVDHLLTAGRGRGLPADGPLSVGGRRLDRSHRLGVPPLLRGCVVVVGGTATRAGRGSWTELVSPGQQTGLHLDVVSGPDAGRSLPLAPGEHVLGRWDLADVRLDDDQVSRRHVVLSVEPSGVTARDAGSTNGTWLLPPETGPESARQSVAGQPLPLPPGGRLVLGGSGVEARVPVAGPARSRPDGAGGLEINRPPRRVSSPPPMTLDPPSRPDFALPSRVPWVSMVLPLVLSTVAAWFLRQPTYLLLGLMSPALVAGTAISERLGRRRRHLRDEQAWRDRVAAAERRACLALTQERAWLRHVVGDPAALSRTAQLPSGRVWERTAGCPDLLLVGVGTGDVGSSRVRWAGEESPDQPVGMPTWRPPGLVMQDAPLTVSLVERGHLGLCGDRRLALRLARWVLGQLAVWHGPDALQLLVVAGDQPDEWRWTRWLPHLVAPTSTPTSDLATVLDEILRRRRLQRLDDRSPARLVVLLDGGHLSHVPAFSAALAGGADLGVHVLCLAEDALSLPSTCGAVVTVDTRGEVTVDHEGSVQRAVVDGARRAWAETVARALAPLVDATPAAGHLPARVPLLPLLSVDGTDAQAVAASWRRRRRCTSVVLGRGLDGPVEVDLVADGPHALVAGTTGSGKSELLRSLVTGLAVRNRPDEMSFLLVDYKGGAAFRGCADLVHTTGLVTDLDDQLAARALTSLHSELRRREGLLRDAGCRDVAEYQGRRDANHDLPPMPRLVIVVDEFRVLATELPAFLDGVVHVASVGRSLGVHLVLATQRPAGVVTADIKANVNLRLCLRVRDRADSEDVLDVGDAAAISPDSPGRALLRRGGDVPVPFQVARLDDGSTVPDQVEVRLWDELPGGARRDRGAPAADHAQSDLGRVVVACRTAAAAVGVAAPAPVWTPPLPATVRLDLAEASACHVPPGAAVVGLVDLPAEQTRDCFSWHPVDDGHLALAGAPRTGRTSALLTIAAGLCRRWSPRDLQLHAIEAAGRALHDLEPLPHVGTVVGIDQPRRVARLVELLGHEVARRHRAGSAARNPALVLLVDGWEAVTERLAGVDHGRPVDDLLALMRDGESAGLRVVVTGGRAVLLSRVAAVVGQRLLLRPNDPTDLLLAGLAPSCVPTSQPPGRALRWDGAEVQIAVPPPVGDIVAAAVDGRPTRCDLSPEERPLRLRPLPSSVAPTALPLTGRPPSWALVGCGGDDHDAVGVDVAVDPFVLVAGPPGSGRSTALATIARSLHARGTAVVGVCWGSSPLARGPWRTLVLDHVDPGQAVAALAASDGVVLVDDADRLRDHPLEHALLAVASEARRSLVVAGATAALAASCRGLALLGRTARTGVLLRPESPADGEVLGVRAQLDDAPPAGRGVLVVRGRQTSVQVAMTPVTAEAKTEGDLSVPPRRFLG